VPEEEWLPPERYRGEQDNFDAEVRRLVALTHESRIRKETLARKLRDRLNGQPYVDAAEWLEQADQEREQRNGRTYPPEWSELARLASELPQGRRHRARPGDARDA
jgi:hypothetical protein